MAAINTRWAVVIKDRYLQEQHLQHHRDSDYVAIVISNTQGREMTENGRNYEFGRTINQVDFYEADSEQEATCIANKFNELWEQGMYKRPSEIKLSLIRQ